MAPLASLITSRSPSRTAMVVSAHRWLTLLFVLLVSPIAAAAPEPTSSSRVELPYVVAEGIAGCLSEQAFLDSVQARLADHSFESPKAISVTTRIERDGERLRATVTLREDGDRGIPSEATQEIFAAADECPTLSATAALAVSLTIQRSRARAQPSPEAPAPTPSKPGPPPTEHPTRDQPRPLRRDAASRDAAPRNAAAREAPELQTQAFLAGAYGVLPSATLGASFGALLKTASWSAGLEGGARLPAEVESASTVAGAKAWLIFLGGSVCANRGRIFVCALGTLGDFRAAGTGRLRSRSTDSTYVALGARVGAEIPVVRPFSLLIHGSVLSPLSRPALRIEDELLWRAPLLGGDLGIGVRMSIL